MSRDITFRVFRQKHGNAAPHFDEFSVEMDPDETVLDGIEKIWAQQDRTLTFRHACHHASCGTCGMRVNGVEKLSCITFLEDVVGNSDMLTVEPMRNFSVISDLVVDMEPFFETIKQTEFNIIRDAESQLANGKPVPADEEFERYENCIECGLCVSACPIVGTDRQFLGPAALAAIWRMVQEPRNHDAGALLELADDTHGVWRCHTGFECTTACPSNVDPAGTIMQLRRRIIIDRLKRFFSLS